MKNERGLTGVNLKGWIPALVLAVILILWEVLARAGALSSLIFPSPSEIIRAFGGSFASGEIIKHTAVTLSRLCLGFLLGSVPGITFGLLLGWSRHLRTIVDPFIAAFHPIPKIAILPLIMLITGIGEFSKVLVIGLSAFFPIAISTMAGVRQINPVYFEVAANYNARWFKVFTRIVLPGSLPLVLAGARLALNVTLIITVAVELVASQHGLGAMIWFAWETLHTEELYAAIFVTGALGITFNFLLNFLSARLVPWQTERQI